MSKQEEAYKVYTVRVEPAGQDISFKVPHGEDPPPKIRLYHGNSSIAVFVFNKTSDSYIQLSNEELEKFDRALRSGECKHSESSGTSRERGDVRLDKQLAKLQKKLKERNSGEQCSYCQQFAGMVSHVFQPSSTFTAESHVQFQIDDLKVSKPKVTSSGPTSAELSWEESVENNEHLTNCTFELEMSKSKNTSFQSVYSGYEQSFLKTDLLPGTKYYFRLRAVKDSIKGQFSPDVFILTDATAPSTPDIPHISSKTKNSLVLKWTIKTDNGSPVTSYILQCDKGHADGQFEAMYAGSQRQYKYNKLQPKTTYRFRVKAINKIGESEFSPVLYYTSSAGVPSTPDPPSLVQATANSLQLSWKKPNTNGAEITEYMLQLDDEHQGYGFLPVYRGLEQSCIVRDNLKRNTSYKFRLSAINVEGESKWSDSVSFATKCQAPGRMLPPILEGKVHAKSFTVSWVAPSDDGGSDIVSFSLEMSKDKGCSFQEVYNGLDTSFKLQDLLPGNSYAVRVSCSSIEFKSPWSDVTSIKTPPVIPDPPSPPRLLKNRKPRAYTIELEWDAPSYNGGSGITKYSVQMKGSVEDDFRYVFLGSKTSCCVASVQPNRKYMFRVQAQNVAGESKFSEISCLSTGPGPPDTVQQLEVVCRSSSAIHVSWKNALPEFPIFSILAKPTGYDRYIPQANNIIKGLLLRNGKDAPNTNGTPVTRFVLQHAKNPNGPYEKLFEGAMNKHEMKKNILPSTEYFFRVQACSVAGSSDWSDVFSCQTPAAPPAQVVDLKLTRRSQTSLTIEWKKPYDNGAAVTSYNVDISGRKLLPYVPEKIENADNASDGETVAFTLLDLQPNTQYRLRVQGVNKSGCGTFSPSVTGTTGKTPPDVPVLDKVNFSYQSVKLRWSFPRPQTEASELRYELQMRSLESNFATVFEGSTTSHKVSKLQEQTQYIFRIRAANESGYGPYSEIFTCKTAVQPPAVVKGLCYSNLNPTSVTISWKNVPPVQPTDGITYILHRNEKESTNSQQLYEGKQTSFTCCDVTSEKTYTFHVCALRTMANGDKIKSPLSPALCLTIPSELSQVSSNSVDSLDAIENDAQPTKLSENQLTGIVFVGITFLVILIALLVSYFIN